MDKYFKKLFLTSTYCYIPKRITLSASSIILSFLRADCLLIHVSPFPFSSVFLFCFFFSYLCVHHLFSSLLFCLFSQACLNILTVLPSFYIHVRFIFQNVYGIFGKKSNKKLIERYEHFALGNCNALKLSRMLKVTVSRYSTTLHFNFSRASFKPRSNFSSSSLVKIFLEENAVLWNLKGALMLAAMIPLSIKRNLKNKCRDLRAIQEEWDSYEKGEWLVIIER